MRNDINDVKKNKLTIKRIICSVVFTLLCQLINVLFINLGIAKSNPNWFFGLLGNNSIALAVASVFLIFLMIMALKDSNIGLWITFCGATSNIIDRLIYGGTLDYFKLPGWPHFNFADLLIIIGLSLFTYRLVSKELQKNLL